MFARLAVIILKADPDQDPNERLRIVFICMVYVTFQRVAFKEVQRHERDRASAFGSRSSLLGRRQVEVIQHTPDFPILIFIVDQIQ